MKPTWVMVDVEADGPCPGLYSMVSLGAVCVVPDLRPRFYGEFHPITEMWMDDALAVAGLTRTATLEFPDAEVTTRAFAEWLGGLMGRGLVPRFVSDNPGFDFSFVNYYLWRFVGRSPFGHSSTNLGSIYKGLACDFYKSFKHLRVTKHTHHPLDDALGNAEAMLRVIEAMARLRGSRAGEVP